MAKYFITGPNQLKGEIAVAGAKNMATKALAACLLTDEPVMVKRVPEIEDVKRLLEILEVLGVKIRNLGQGSYELQADSVNPAKLDFDMVARLRASIVLLGPLLARYQEVKFPHPGGCIIGKRPIDLFLKGFAALGAKVEQTENLYKFKSERLQGTDIIFSQVSVTGTETLMLAAVLSQGMTKLINAAQEPEIAALAEFLNKQGAKISGAGTNEIIIKGVDKIGGGEIEIIPDRIETGSFIALALATKSEIIIKNCQPQHLLIPLVIFREMGAQLKVGSDFIQIKPTKRLRGVKVKTHEYPGFATDLQAPFTVLVTQAEGLSLIHETIYEGRLFYIDYLNRMGANIILCDPHRAIINGPTNLRGKKLESPDLRAGIAMVIAGLSASGQTEIDNIYQIERGYEGLIAKLQSLGAKIERVDED